MDVLDDLLQTHVWFYVDDAHPSSSQHVVDGVGAGAVQVSFMLTVLHEPEHTHVKMEL